MTNKTEQARQELAALFKKHGENVNITDQNIAAEQVDVAARQDAKVKNSNIMGGNVQISAGRGVHISGGSIIAGGGIKISGANVVLNGATITSSGDLSITSDSLAVEGDSTLAAKRARVEGEKLSVADETSFTVAGVEEASVDFKDQQLGTNATVTTQTAEEAAFTLANLSNSNK